MTLFSAVRLRERGVRPLFYFGAKLVILPLVRARRRRLRGMTVVGVTGSGGKTTTKNLVAAVLATRGPTLATRGSGNRAKSTARLLLRARRGDRFCVQEVAAFAPDTLDEVLWPLEPDVGVVTNVGWDHYVQFRGREGVAREKRKLVEALPESGVAVLNADDPLVRAMAESARARVILYGLSPEAAVRAEDVSSSWPDPLSFVLVHGGERHRVQTRLHGRHWVHAVLAAVATGVAVGVPVSEAVAAVASVEPTPHRLSVVTLDSGVTFVQDDWKAPAWTVPASLEFLGEARAPRRIAVLGQLSDDPTSPRRLYARLAREARAHADVVLLVGRWAHEGLRARAGDDDRSILAFTSALELHRFLESFLAPGDLVLVKATCTTDHAERIVLARTGQVDCWRTDCGLTRVCERCPRLTASRGDRTA